MPLKFAVTAPRGPSGGVKMFTPKPNELFYFGVTYEKFVPHKAGRIIGCFKMPNETRPDIPCFLIEYPDGELAHAPFEEESQGSFEILDYETAVKKHGEEAFQ